MCKTVPSTVSAVCRRSHTEGLSEEFMKREDVDRAMWDRKG